MVVSASDTVNSSEPLDNAHRVPMNVIVDEVVAVLQVLTFGNTVGCNQNIKLIGTSGQEYRPFLWKPGEKQVRTVLRSARSFGMVVLPSTVPVISAVSQPKILFRKSADVCKEIVCGIRECRENNDLLIARIDGMLDFLPD